MNCGTGSSKVLFGPSLPSWNSFMISATVDLLRPEWISAISFFQIVRIAYDSVIVGHG